jgi:hypothetical protein
VIYLECPLCGCPAVIANDDGLFMETDEIACLSCHYPGRVVVDEFAGGVDDEAIAYWHESDFDSPAVKEWELRYPVQAAELYTPGSLISTLPE